jgi:geranylgeranyl reductase family protein
MSLPEDYDVIVVGAGPAGATLAYELASAGIRVLVIEKNTLPRDKCCGGGITFRTSKLLDSSIADILGNPISSATIFYGNSQHRETTEQVIMYTVARDRFDHALVKRAEKAGATVLQGVTVRDLQTKDDCVEVLTDKLTFRSQFVAGADGALSVVARAIGVESNKNLLFCIETRVQVAEEDLAKWRSQIALATGRGRSVYGWVFPKSDHLSVGVGGPRYSAKNLKSRYFEFLDCLNLNGYSITHWKGGLIPACDGHAVVTMGRVALLGDAAGLADPLTGEGIHNAILSAKLAGLAIRKSLASGEPGLNEYTEAVGKRILPEMKIAFTFYRTLSLVPGRVFNALQLDKRAWRGCCHLLRGEMDYSTVRNRLNDLGGLRNFILKK